MATNTQTSQEMDFKRYFCEKYFQKNTYQFDINYVDVVLQKNNKPIMYIEFKHILTNEKDVESALAQIVLTNKIQQNILSKLAIVYKDKDNNDNLIFIDCSDDSIMYHNDINWNKEKRSNPSDDAVTHIYNRIKNHLIIYTNDEIFGFYKSLISQKDLSINITVKNFNTVYNEWKNEIEFKESTENEQELICLFFVDILNNTKYENKVKNDLLKNPVSFEGTDLNYYKISTFQNDIAFIYQGKRTILWTIKDSEKYHNFWLKYHRPPEENEFLKILERSAILYTYNYRRTTGAEYTPSCFVKLQNDILFNDKSKLNLNIDDFIFFDPCCGVGNLENDFGMDYKDNCFLSTLEANDVEICKIKGFENVKQFDFLDKDRIKDFPLFMYKGDFLNVSEIAKIKEKKLVIIMNPPYYNKKGVKNNLAIEFFKKCLKLKPDFIVFYYMTESFFRDEIKHYLKSKYTIVSHVMCDAKSTFQLSEWPISQIIFSKEKLDNIYANKYDIKTGANVFIDRYKVNKENSLLDYVKSYTYNNSRKNLIKSIEIEIKKNAYGMVLGQWSYLQNVINIGNGGIEREKFKITTKNLKYCLISKGLNFNTHAKYFEYNDYVYRGKFSNISEELQNDAIMFSLFYKGNFFSNKLPNKRNFLMPFTKEELKGFGFITNDFNTLLRQQSDILGETDTKEFDFRIWLQQFKFSNEALALKSAALNIFKYYHKHYKNTNPNDSFYDITNTIMKKNSSQFKSLDSEKDTRINKIKTTKGTRGFGRNTIKSVIKNEDDLKMFYDFFDKRDILAKKINKQLVEQGLLLWERENIY